MRRFSSQVKIAAQYADRKEERNLSMSEAAERFLDEIHPEFVEMESGSHKKWSRELRIWIKQFADELVTPRTIMAYRHSLLSAGYATKTIHDIEYIASRFLTWCVKRGMIPGNPYNDVRRIRVVHPKIQPITEPQYLRLRLRARGTPLYYCVVCGWETGMRLSDVALLKWEHVDMENCVISKIQHKCRRSGEKARVIVPFDPGSELAATLKALLPVRTDEWVHHDAATLYLRGVLAIASHHLFKKCGCAHAQGFHSLRRGRFSALANTTEDQTAIRILTGSTDQKIFQRYVTPELNHLRGVTAKAARFQAVVSYTRDNLRLSTADQPKQLTCDSAPASPNPAGPDAGSGISPAHGAITDADRTGITNELNRR